MASTYEYSFGLQGEPTLPKYDSFDSINKIATLQSPPVMPDWLPTNPDDLMGELIGQYNQSPGFGQRGTRNAFNKSIDTTMGMGGQIADNAAREAMARAGMEGGGVNSAMVKAQTMLPVYDASNSLRTDKAAAIADIRQKKANYQSGLAAQLGQMRTGYLSMLADAYLKGQGQTNQWVQSQQQLELERQRLNLAGSGKGRSGGFDFGSGGGSGAGSAGVMTTGYIPNAGPIQGGSVNGVATPNNVYTPDYIRAMGYSLGGG